MFEKIKVRKQEKEFQKNMTKMVQNFNELSQLMEIQMMQIDQASKAIDEVTEKYLSLLNK